MPNHVMNILTFDCSEEQLKEVLSAICYDENAESADLTGPGTIDFNKITPMPPSLDIECGSRTIDSVSLYLTSLNPDVHHFGEEKLDHEAFQALLAQVGKRRSYIDYNPAMSQEQIKKCTQYTDAETLLEMGKTAVNNQRQYGATTWYEWRTRPDTWNTKWNSYYPGDYQGDNEITFQTAWDAPHPLIAKLSSMYPEVTIKHRWANEDLWQECGSRTYLGGEMIDYDFPDNDKEQIETAASIWDIPIKDYGYVESALGNSYVNIEAENLDLVSVCGQPALFSNERLSENEIPRGLFLYHLRSGSDGEQFCAIEKKVAVNHGGSIVTSEPLDLGEDELIMFDDNHTLSFMGERMTFEQFMEGDLETKGAMDLG